MKTKYILLAAMIWMIGCTSQPAADIVVKGKIWTSQMASPIAEAMAIQGDTIVAIGSWDVIKGRVGDNTQVIDAGSGLVVPGFIDTHTHFLTGGYQLASVQLKDAKTPAEFITRIKDFIATQKPGTWILGGTWDNEQWGGELPTRDWIDSISTQNPVWVTRFDGHMSVANTLALKAAGLTDAVRDVAGGTFVRDSKGRLTGAIKDNAGAFVEKVIPAPSAEQDDAALAAAMDYVASKGVTTIHSMSGGWDAYERAHQSGKLITRIYAGAMLPEWKMVAEKVKNGRGDSWLRYGNLKQFVDGSLGSHTAAFLEPFSDSPKDAGFFTTPPEELYRDIKAADSAGLHLMIHAIGDRGIRTLLDIFERVSKENGPRDRRFRIEHAQHIHPQDIPRFKALDVIASMQPYHAIDDGRFAEKLIGYERCKTTYSFKSLMDAGARVAFGSDWFVAPPTPLEGIYAAATRRTLDGKNPNGWIPEQKITVEQALYAYTIQGAYASFEENVKGSLEAGKLADFVVIDKDILTIAPENIAQAKVLSTWVGGKKVFEAR